MEKRERKREGGKDEWCAGMLCWFAAAHRPIQPRKVSGGGAAALFSGHRVENRLGSEVEERGLTIFRNKTTKA